MGAFVGFRIGKKDQDIEQDLARFTDLSKRVREMYRLGMAVERGEYVKVSALSEVLPKTVPEEREVPSKPISWSFPKEPTVKPPAPQAAPVAKTSSKAALKRNMLQGF